MAYEAFAGSSGAVYLAQINPDLTTDEINFTGDTAVVAEISSWRIRDGRTAQAKKLTFGSDVNSQGILYPTQLRGGTAEWTATISGVLSATTATFIQGQALIVDFMVKKNVAHGYVGCNCVIVDVEPNDEVSAQHASFTIQVVGSGVLPAFS